MECYICKGHVFRYIGMEEYPKMMCEPCGKRIRRANLPLDEYEAWRMDQYRQMDHDAHPEKSGAY